MSLVHPLTVYISNAMINDLQNDGNKALFRSKMKELNFIDALLRLHQNMDQKVKPITSQPSASHERPTAAFSLAAKEMNNNHNRKFNPLHI